MKRAVCALLPLLLWACEPAVLPSPSIVSVEPQQIPRGSASALLVKVSAVLPISVNYKDETVDPAQLAMTVRLAGQVVDIPFAYRDGTLVVPVPEGLELGEYDIRVTLADGREAVRERGFSVVPESTLIGTTEGDGGIVEDGGVGTSGDSPDILFFWIDPIEDQIHSVPFKITIRAIGRGARSFHEPLTLRASKGRLASTTPGTFSEGVRTEEISLSAPGHSVYLMVEDAYGHRGLSNPFRVFAN